MKNTIKTVIVIGGGIAGLKTSLDLARADYQVTLLEAKERLGGRIYTIMASDNKTPIELGASYWEGYNDCPFYQQYFSSNDKTKANTILLDGIKSDLISIDSTRHIENSFQYYQLAKAMLLTAERKGVGKTFKQFINEFDLRHYSNEQKYWLNRFLENSLQHHCTPLSEGGFPSFERNNSDHAESWNDEMADFCFVQNGYDKVIQQIANECENAGVNIHLNSPVYKILDLGKSGVKIISKEGIFTADKIISTIPIGVLKKQVDQLFEPCLSDDKKMAINTIGIHDATRVILEFAGEPFWDNPDGPYIYLDSVLLPCLLEFRNAYPLCGKAILLTGKYSDTARLLFERYPNDYLRAQKELISKIMSDLRKAFPNKNIPEPKKTWVYCWTHDPFAQGAYPYRTANINEQIQCALERPEGNLYFAGADFSRYGFSVHNAYNNGRKVAKALIESSS
jgi:monoamine oxidase